MSNYTMELRHICEQLAGLSETDVMFANPETVIETARPLLFDFEYPLFDPTHKAELERKIIEHFYVREIGAETVGLFKLYLRRTLREIMPPINQLYYSAALEYNPLTDVDVTRTHTGTEAGSNTSSGTRSGQTSGSGSLHATGSGTSGNTRTEGRELDETVNTQTETDGTGTSSKTTHTATETDAETNSTGSKDTSANYTDDLTHRDAYSNTPESTIQGVEGTGGSGTDNVGANYWLTDYRKITDHKSGNSSADEDTTGHETVHTESTGDQTETGNTTDHSTGTGSTVTDRDESATITDAGSTSDTRDESTNTAGTSDEQTSGEGAYDKSAEWTEHVTGKQGSQSYAEMVQAYRDTIINIDMMVIEGLEPCFMQIF